MNPRSLEKGVPKTMPYTSQEFEEVYQEAVRQVLAHWTREMQVELAAHCYGWHPDRFDFGRYLQASSSRYYRAYTAITRFAQGRSICDVGGFWGVFPVTLRRLGYEVTMTESLKFYSGSFNKLFSAIQDQGVRIVDMDPFESLVSETAVFDFVTVMAVLEHYPHSPKQLLENIIAMLKRDGSLYIEVPNIAYWPKRMALLRGQTPLVPIEDIIRSAVPFIGHHHEYTLPELRYLVTLLGLRILNESSYNYSQEGGVVARLFQNPIMTLACLIRPDSRECLAMTCTRS